MNITQLLISYIIKHGVDAEGTEVIYELPCGCMVAREEAGDEFIPCDTHDADSIANDGKELSDMAELIVAAVGQPLVETADEDVFPDAPPLEESVDIMDYANEFADDAGETTVDALEDLVEEITTNEKDEETMTIKLTSTRKTITFEISVKTDAGYAIESNTGYKVEANVDVALAVHKRNKGWTVTELTTGYAVQHGATIKAVVTGVEALLNRVGMAKFNETLANQRIVTPVDNTHVIEETPAMESLEDLVADDAPMVDDEPVVETTVEPMTATEEIHALAAELVALTTKGASIATLMKAVRENAGRIVELTTDGDVTPPTPPTTKVKPEPKKAKETTVTEQPVQKGASEASAFSKFKSAKIIEAGTHSVTFEADDKQFIFLKNDAGKTIIRELGSNSNSYMSGKYLQSLIYDINTATSRALFRKIKDIISIKAPTTQVDGAASEASAKENNSTAKNNPADTMTIKGIDIPKAWFNTYVADDTMTKKHGHSKMSADTIIAEYQAKK